MKIKLSKDNYPDFIYLLVSKENLPDWIPKPEPYTIGYHLKKLLHNIAKSDCELEDNDIVIMINNLLSYINTKDEIPTSLSRLSRIPEQSVLFLYKHINEFKQDWFREFIKSQSFPLVQAIAECPDCLSLAPEDTIFRSVISAFLDYLLGEEKTSQFKRFCEALKEALEHISSEELINTLFDELINLYPHVRSRKQFIECIKLFEKYMS